MSRRCACAAQGNRAGPLHDETRNVLVLYTGGTIGMKKNEDDVYAPVPNVFTDKVKTCQELHDPVLAKNCQIKDELLVTRVSHQNHIIVYQIREYQPLLDSCNVGIKEWTIIAKDIEKNYDLFDGFVILHGTDTLAFTSSVLSFMLGNLQKPVILTGAMVPIFESPSDAKNNFLSALQFASSSEICEVCIFFSDKLMRGNRVRKINTAHLDAFESPNYHNLAQTGFQNKIFYHYLLKSASNDKQLHVCLNLCQAVGIVYVFPTITQAQLISFLEPTLEGVVLMTFGAGNFPSHRQDLLDALKDAVARGVTVVIVTQCGHGTASFSYETGKCMEEIGIISCNDMTAEAAYAKLVVVCGMTSRREDRAKLMKEDLRGEMTIYNNK